MLAYFVAFCAILLGVAAIVRRHHREQVLTTWPTTAATIRSCGVHRDYPFQRDGGGITFWVACDVDYAVAGKPRSARLTSTVRHTGRSGTYITFGGSVATVRPEPLLQGWVKRHPAGSTLSVRYDPSNASAPTFVGVDDVVDVDPVPETVLGVEVFAAIAIVAAMLARLLARRERGGS